MGIPGDAPGYCPVSRLGEHVGETVVTCGLVVEQGTHHQITGEPRKFLIGGFDGYRGDGIVGADLQESQAGDGALSDTGR